MPLTDCHMSKKLDTHIQLYLLQSDNKRGTEQLPAPVRIMVHQPDRRCSLHQARYVLEEVIRGGLLCLQCSGLVGSSLEYLEGLGQIVIQLQNCSHIATSIAIVRCGPYRYQLHTTPSSLAQTIRAKNFASMDSSASKSLDATD